MTLNEYDFLGLRPTPTLASPPAGASWFSTLTRNAAAIGPCLRLNLRTASYRLRSRYRRRVVEDIFISLWHLMVPTLSTRLARVWIQDQAAVTASVLEARLLGLPTPSIPMPHWHPLLSGLPPAAAAHAMQLLSYRLNLRWNLRGQWYEIVGYDTCKPTLH